jgi:nucleotide-binding universal stress UspA family protein
MLKTILVPLDGYPRSEDALPWAQTLAGAAHARLVLMRAALGQEIPGVDPSKAQLRAIAEAQSYLTAIAARLSQTDLSIETVVPYGSAAEAILLEAQLRQADLVVMATHARSQLGRVLYGSVAERLLPSIAAPVLLIPDGGPHQYQAGVGCAGERLRPG